MKISRVKHGFNFPFHYQKTHLIMLSTWNFLTYWRFNSSSADVFIFSLGQHFIMQKTHQKTNLSPKQIITLGTTWLRGVHKNAVIRFIRMPLSGFNIEFIQLRNKIRKMKKPDIKSANYPLFCCSCWSWSYSLFSSWSWSCWSWSQSIFKLKLILLKLISQSIFKLKLILLKLIVQSVFKLKLILQSTFKLRLIVVYFQAEVDLTVYFQAEVDRTVCFQTEVEVTVCFQTGPHIDWRRRLQLLITISD